MGLKIGIVGVGSFAQSFIPLFQAHPLVAEVVLCDIDAAKLAENARKHGIEKTFPSLDAVCESDVDAAIIITQNWLHGPQAAQALRAGKHVYSAVPAGITVEEIRDFIEADSLAYLSMDGLLHCCTEGDAVPNTFCTACYTGEYPTQLVDVTEILPATVSV